MQRPRRTSQLHDEQLPSIRRQSRQSRIAVRTRSPSAEHQGPNFTNAVSMSVLRGTTPQRTPLTKNLLSTAEKHRNPSVTNFLHNDKKWIQEQTARITEHLISVGTISGMSTNFLSRGLRQISIKQFVAIVNYFLSHIGGNRYIIGSNYVEDIVNILQKLQYPYLINKSWLKTPNTQHSFGNVILLLDFLMEFVPNNGYSGFEIEVDKSQCTSKQKLNEELQIPDKDFQEKLLRYAKQSFLLWDKQVLDSYAKLQCQACDIVILKYCGIQDINALDKEILDLKQLLLDVEKDLPPKDDKIKRKNMQLASEIDLAKTELTMLKEDHASNNVEFKRLLSVKEDTVKDIEKLKYDIRCLQENIKTQVYTVEQRDKLVTDVEQLKLFLAIEERTVVDLENRDYNQQVLLSRAIKQFTDVIEHYNLHMRNIAYSEAFGEDIVSNKNLKLSLHLDESNLQQRSQFLNNIKKQVEETIKCNNKLIKQFKQKNDNLNNVIITKLAKQFNILTLYITNMKKNLKELNVQINRNEIILNSKYERLTNEVLVINKKVSDISMQIKNTNCQIEQQKLENEKFYIESETKFKNRIIKRKSFLLDFKSQLELCMQSSDVEQLLSRFGKQDAELAALKECFRRRRNGEN